MRFLLSVGFLLCFASGCDTAPVADDPSTSLKAAQQWYEAETGLTTFQPSSARVSGDAHLTQFYPDWAAGEVVTAPNGLQIVVTRLSRNADVTYDSRVDFLRVLAVYLAADGSVDRASILNFISPNPISEDDGPALVAALADGSIHQRDVIVMEHTVRYDLLSARQYRPDGQVSDLDWSSEEVTDRDTPQGRDSDGSSTRMANRYVCIVVLYEYWAAIGDSDHSDWRTGIRSAECYSVIGGDIDTSVEDEGYSGGSGPGGDGESSGAALPGATFDDLIPDDDPTPDCSQPQTIPWKIAYCARTLPNPTQKTRLEDAISNIRGRGGSCVAIADTAAARLSAGQIQFYPTTPGVDGGYGRTDIGIIMDVLWVTSYHSTPTAGETDLSGNPIRRSLEQTLVHETEHVMGESHTDGERGFRTPNSGICSGFSESRRGQA